MYNNLENIPVDFKADLTVVGGMGHVGLPISIAFANKNLKVISYDKNIDNIKYLKKEKMPFVEYNGDKNLKKSIRNQNIKFTNKLLPNMKGSDFLITVGTPIDEFQNPSFIEIKKCVDEILPFVSKKNLIMLRSTIFPGTTDWIEKYVQKIKPGIKIVFCLERILQGKAFEELFTLPQIIASNSNIGAKKAGKLFKKISPKIIYCKPKEAEFSKLFCNAFRYIEFAISNQFYVIASKENLDFSNILNLIKQSYPRGKNLPSPGFTAGPCLLKDTLQLVSHSQNQFSLGNDAMLINEGLILEISKKLQSKFNLNKSKIGLLGMAFKADVDDTRSSLSYKLKKFLQFYAKSVITTDPYVKNDSNLLPLSYVLKNSDIIVICVPHKKYKNLKTEKPILDIWNHTSLKNKKRIL